MSGIDGNTHETLAGHCVAMAALIIALDENGVLPKHDYCDTLRRLWLQMPEEEAVGDAGTVIERMLDFLDPSADPALPSDIAKPAREIHRFGKKPVNDDDDVMASQTRLRAWLHAI